MIEAVPESNKPESALVNVKKLIERALDYVSSVLLSDGVREH